MFGQTLSVVVIGQGSLAKQTSLLANRWAKISTFEVDSIPQEFDCQNYDLVLICIENTNDVEKDTADVIEIIERWESQSPKLLHNVIVRTIVTPGTASRVGVHLWNSFGTTIKNQKLGLFGLNSTVSIPPHKLSRLEDSLVHLLDSAFQSGILNIKPKLDIVSLQEAESTLFARQALDALTSQFNSELASYLQNSHLPCEKILTNLNTSSDSPNLNLPVAHSCLECWLGSMSEHSTTFPLLTRLNNLLMK